MIDEIVTHGVVSSHAERHFQFCPHAVNRRDEHGPPVSGKIRIEKGAEGSDVGQHAGRERLAYERPDAVHSLFSSFNIYSGVLVRGHPGHVFV